MIRVAIKGVPPTLRSIPDNRNSEQLPPQTPAVSTPLGSVSSMASRVESEAAREGAAAEGIQQPLGAGDLLKTVTLPKPLTSGAKAEGRFGKQYFVYEAEVDTYRCPAGEQLPYRYTNVEGGLTLRRYWTTACHGCALKARCTPAKERRVTRWEHEAVLEAAQRRPDADPHAMRTRRQTVEHVFGTLKGWMGATHFRTRRLRNVATEMSLQVLAYNLKRVLAILGVEPLLTTLRA